RGNSLFLYEDETQETYLEKLELSQLKSMQLESSYKKKEAAVFRLSLPKEELHLKDADTGEEWRGYILTMKEIPNKLDLLPGQKVKLEDALKQETKRVFPLSRPVLPPRPAFMQSESLTDSPACFYDVTRKEAEQMLEENPENGGIILRPSTVPNNYALTLRHQLEIMKKMCNKNEDVAFAYDTRIGKAGDRLYICWMICKLLLTNGSFLQRRCRPLPTRLKPYPEHRSPPCCIRRAETSWTFLQTSSRLVNTFIQTITGLPNRTSN
uniref:SH2 domain-containing protein n=1 Tax=Oryzias melastigma TaxID=30732 RepID=A0A3B3CLC7_ORYME